MHVKIKRGLDLRLGTTPEGRIAGTKSSSSAAVLGRDFPGVKFEVLVDVGARVAAGEPMLRDRHRTDIVFTAPLSGTIAAVNRGARRALLSIQVVADGGGGATAGFPIPAVLDKDAARHLMLVSGLWTTLRKRPFGHIPDPDAEPNALLITAIDTEPLAPDPALVIAAHADPFTSGLKALTAICDAPVYLCQATGAEIPMGQSNRVRVAEFSGPHPAGLPGTHIFSLCPIGFNGSEVWHIGYQDVIALGHLVITGKPWLQRVVTIAGPAVQHPRLLTVPLAAAVDELVAGELKEGPVRVISGSALSGHTARGAEAFLGQRHNQVTVLPEAASENPRRRHGAFDTWLGGDPGPLIPIGDLERLAPPGILPVPLMRALLVGDIERARELGALELVEEDLALITYGCSSKNDYGKLLRDVLDQLHKEAT